MQTTLSLAFLCPLLLCACVPDPIEKSVLPVDALSITVSPPATITFDDVAFTRGRPLVHYGDASCLHTTGGHCCNIPGWIVTCTGSKSPCVIRAWEVFEEIADYRALKARELDDSEPMYWYLLGRANEKFHAAVRAVLREYPMYDTIIEEGHVKLRKPCGGIPDLTSAVVEIVRRP